MSHFQAVVILSNGAMVMFGVSSSDGETGALLAARARLASFGQQAEQVHLLELPGRRER